jgi:predicted ATPase with chaperone activity
MAVLGLALPPRHITFNLAPADVIKEGSHFELPIVPACSPQCRCCRKTTWAASSPPASWRPRAR